MRTSQVIKNIIFYAVVIAGWLMMSVYDGAERFWNWLIIEAKRAIGTIFMKRIFLITLLLFLSAFTALGTTITISSTAINNWRYGGTSATLRVFADTKFITNDGQIIMPGQVALGNWYKEIICPVAGTTLTIPAFTIDSTTDSTVARASYTFVLFDHKNLRRDTYADSFRIPTSFGTTVSWTQLIGYNQAQPRPPTPGVYDSDQTNAQVTAILQSYANANSLVTSGDTRLVTNLSVYSDSLAAAVASIGGTETVLSITRPVTVNTLTVPKNIKIEITGTGLITVATNQVLTIGSLNNPGNRKIFDSTASGAKVLFQKGAVKEINIAWWVGNTSGANITDALSEALESANTNQGIIHFPTGVWLSSGGHIISDGVVLEGEGNYVSAGLGTSVKLSSPSTTYLFKIGEGEFGIRFKDLILDGTGTTSKDGVLFQGTYPNTSGDVSFTNVTFNAFQNGININSLGGDWQLAQLLLTSCVFQGNTNSGIKANSINGQITTESTNFAVPSNGWAFDFLSVGLVTIKGSEFAGAGASSGVMKIGGAHPPINIIGSQDENFGTFIQNDASDISGLINLDGNLIQSKIKLNQTCRINSRSNNYRSNSWKTTNPDSSLITSIGDYVNVLDLVGVSVGTPYLMDLTSTGGAIFQIDESSVNYTNTYRTPSKFISPPIYDSQPTIPIVGIGNYTATSTDKPALRIGRTDIFGVFDYYYDVYRKYLNGRLQFVGNQSGFIGYDFNGDITASRFIGDVVTPAQITANQNNYSPGSTAQTIRLASDASRNITGFDIAQVANQQHWVFNVGSFNVVLKNEDAASLAANRLKNNTGADITLLPNDVAFLQYDATVSRWRVAKYSASVGTNNTLAKFSANNSVNSTISDTGSLVTVSNPLTVTGAATLSTSATVGTTLNVTGAATFAKTLNLSATNALTPSASVAVNASLGNVFTLTPGEDESITVSSMVIGQPLWLIVLTSGTTSRTLTFSTGFKTSGTLATGTVSGKYFVLQFFCDAAQCYEISRTAAL